MKRENLRKQLQEVLRRSISYESIKLRGAYRNKQSNCAIIHIIMHGVLTLYVTKYTEKSEVRTHEALIVGDWPESSGSVVKTVP